MRGRGRGRVRLRGRRRGTRGSIAGGTLRRRGRRRGLRRRRRWRRSGSLAGKEGFGGGGVMAVSSSSLCFFSLFLCLLVWLGSLSLAAVRAGSGFRGILLPVFSFLFIYHLPFSLQTIVRVGGGAGHIVSARGPKVNYRSSPHHHHNSRISLNKPSYPMSSQ